MKVELTKKEIEVILDLMEYGVTFLTSHGCPEEPKEPTGVVNINKLESKLRSYLKK